MCRHGRPSRGQCLGKAGLTGTAPPLGEPCCSFFSVSVSLLQLSGLSCHRRSAGQGATIASLSLDLPTQGAQGTVLDLSWRTQEPLPRPSPSVSPFLHSLGPSLPCGPPTPILLSACCWRSLGWSPQRAHGSLLTLDYHEILGTVKAGRRKGQIPATQP